MTLWYTLLCFLLGCQTSPYPAPVPGSAYRIGEDSYNAQSEVYVDLLTTEQECLNAGVDDLEACLPRADRAAGEVQLGFLLRDPQNNQPVYRSLTDDQIRVTHDKFTQQEAELVPHEPVEGGQLFILLIDGSGSMYDNEGERIKKVYQALLEPTVVQGFYPSKGSNKSGVVLLRFSDEVRGLDGGPPKVVKEAKQYRKLIRENLMRPSGGYTHLYGAIRYGISDLLNTKAISDYLTVTGAEPTFVVLTDGFNNETAKDTCGDNVPRLQETLDALVNTRTSGTATTRPVVYTVGLGKPISGRKEAPSRNAKVTLGSLCPSYADRRIDGDLENNGIDNISLQWLAQAGGGYSFVKRNPAGLAEVFKRAARPRYRWYEVRYRTTDALYHRKSFDVGVQLTSAELAVSTVRLFPSAWIDAPTGRRDQGDGWAYPTSFRESLMVLLVPLALLVFLFFLSPAVFTARRGVTR